MATKNNYEQRASECLHVADRFQNDDERRLMRALALHWHQLSVWTADHNQRPAVRGLGSRAETFAHNDGK
jgi:hypothetical protein